MNTDVIQSLRDAERGIGNLDVLEHDEQHEALAMALAFVCRAVRQSLPSLDHQPIIPMWIYLPNRDTAINLAHVSRVDFSTTDDDYALVYFDHAECGDEDIPGYVTHAYMPISGADTAAIRAALGLPAPPDA